VEADGEAEEVVEEVAVVEEVEVVVADQEAGEEEERIERTMEVTGPVRSTFWMPLKEKLGVDT
jgi:hypothetical protein